MRILRMIIVAAPFALVLGGCNLAAPCEEIVSTTDNSQGTFSFKETSVAHVSGTIPGSCNDLTVQGGGPSTVAVTGDFVDQTGNDHSFSLSVTLTSSSGNMQLGNESKACIDELPCSALTGTLDVSSFSTDCMGQDECALTIVGNLNASTTWKGGSFGVNLSLDHADSWQSYACNNGQGGE